MLVMGLCACASSLNCLKRLGDGFIVSCTVAPAINPVMMVACGTACNNHL